MNSKLLGNVGFDCARLVLVQMYEREKGSLSSTSAHSAPPDKLNLKRPLT